MSDLKNVGKGSLVFYALTRGLANLFGFKMVLGAIGLILLCNFLRSGSEPVELQTGGIAMPCPLSEIQSRCKEKHLTNRSVKTDEIKFPFYGFSAWEIEGSLDDNPYIKKTILILNERSEVKTVSFEFNDRPKDKRLTFMHKSDYWNLRDGWHSTPENASVEVSDGSITGVRFANNLTIQFFPWVGLFSIENK